MMDDPLSRFIQNGSKVPNDAVPVNYHVVPKAAEQQKPFGGFFDFLNPINILKKQFGEEQVDAGLKVIRDNGGDGKAAFYAKCKEMNVENPDQILKQVENNPLFKQFFK